MNVYANHSLGQMNHREYELSATKGNSNVSGLWAKAIGFGATIGSVTLVTSVLVSFLS